MIRKLVYKVFKSKKNLFFYLQHNKKNREKRIENLPYVEFGLRNYRHPFYFYEASNAIVFDPLFYRKLRQRIEEEKRAMWNSFVVTAPYTAVSTGGTYYVTVTTLTNTA